MLKKSSLKFVFLTVFFVFMTTFIVAYADEGDQKEYSESITFDNVSFNKATEFKEITLKEPGFYDITVECDKMDQVDSNFYTYFLNSDEQNKENDNDNDQYDSFVTRDLGKKYENMYWCGTNTTFMFAVEISENYEYTGVIDNHTVKLTLSKHNLNLLPEISDTMTTLTYPERGSLMVRFTPKEDGTYALKIPEYDFYVYDEIDCADIVRYLFWSYEINDKGEPIESEDINKYCESYRFIKGNHNAIDIPGMKKGKTYYMILYLDDYLARIRGDSTTDCSTDVSIAPTTIESFSLTPEASSYNSFQKMYYYELPKYTVKVKYKGEEETILKGLKSYNSYSLAAFDMNVSPADKYDNSLPGIYSVNSSFLGLDSKATFTITSGYKYACKVGAAIKTTSKIYLTKGNSYGVYRTFTAPENGTYRLVDASTKKYPESISFYILNLFDNEPVTIIDEGYKLEKGEKYALFIKGSSPSSLMFVTNNNHKSKKVTIKAVQATYTHAGRTSQVVCTKCGKIIQKSKVIPRKVLPKVAIVKAKLAKGKKSATLAWKVKKGKYSYQIQYSTDKKFKKGNKLLVASASKSSVSIKKLSKKKKYYVRVRSVIVENKKKVYGKWSTIKVLK